MEDYSGKSLTERYNAAKQNYEVLQGEYDTLTARVKELKGNSENLSEVSEEVKKAYEQSRRRITTGLLNDILADAQAALQPPATSGRRLKIYYATQQGVQPPSFVFFVNDENLMHFSYERYLEKQFRKSFGFEGTPLKFILREKKRDDQ